VRLTDENLIVRGLDDEVVMLSLPSSTYYSANEAGALLVHELIRGAERASLIALLMERYGITQSVAATDVDEFLHQLRKHELLVDS